MIHERHVVLHLPPAAAGTDALNRAGAAQQQQQQQQATPPAAASGRCMLVDPCQVFNSPSGVTLQDTAAIVYEAFRVCSQLSRGGHVRDAAGSSSSSSSGTSVTSSSDNSSSSSSDLRLDVYRRVTRDPHTLDCVVAAAHRSRDSPHWQPADAATRQACAEMCEGRHTRAGKDWSAVLEEEWAAAAAGSVSSRGEQ